MKINHNSLSVFLAICSGLLVAILAALYLAYIYKMGGNAWFGVNTPTTYDGLSYYNEILAYQSMIESFNIAGLVTAYGALVVLIYSPIVISPQIASWWPLCVNSVLLFSSAFLFALALAKAASFRICSNFIGTYQTCVKRTKLASIGPLTMFCILFLVLLNPYYVGSLLVPSKDILALTVSVGYLFYLISTLSKANPASRPSPRLLIAFSTLLLLAFAVRITLFLGLFFCTVYFLLRSSWLPRFVSHPLSSYLLSAFISATIFLYFQTVSFESAGSALNSAISSGYKYLFIPILPFIYSLWDFFKSPTSLMLGFNIVQFSFSVNGIFALSLIVPFFLLLYFRSFKSVDASTRKLWAMTSIAIAVPICSGYVHVRYLYEFFPWMLVSLSFRFGYRFILVWATQLLPLAFVIKLLLGFFGLLIYSPNLPEYVLPPFLM